MEPAQAEQMHVITLSKEALEHLHANPNQAEVLQIAAETAHSGPHMQVAQEASQQFPVGQDAVLPPQVSKRQTQTVHVSESPQSAMAN